MTKVTILRIVISLSTNKNIRERKKYVDKIIFFSTRLNYANKKIGEKHYSMAKTTYNSTEVMVNKLQSLKGKTKLKFYKNKSNYFDEMKNKTFQFEQDPFSENAQGISKIYQKALLILKIF